MKMLRNERLGRLTPHEDLGIDAQGRHRYRCLETGDERGITKAQRERIVANRMSKNEDNAGAKPTFVTMKDQDVSVLKEYVDQQKNSKK